MDSMTSSWNMLSDDEDDVWVGAVHADDEAFSSVSTADAVFISLIYQYNIEVLVCRLFGGSFLV